MLQSKLINEPLESLPVSIKIVIEEPTVMVGLCGSNDRNLLSLEEAIGASVFCRGNELHLQSVDETKKALFHTIVHKLQDLLRSGQIVTPDLISSILEGVLSGDFNRITALSEGYIQIPQGFSKVFPRTLGQAGFIEGMRTKDISFGVGPAGTGKTFLAIAQALFEVLSKKKRKLIMTRPVVEAGENLGFLPGDLAQKISPYLRPLYDAMEDLVPPEVLTRMEESRIIEIAPLAYMRGRSLKNCVVVLDEAQNTTRPQMKMFLTRLGEGSKAFITGDPSQVDLPRPQESGLLEAVNRLSQIPEIHFSHFQKKDVVRNPLIKKIIEAYES